MNENQQINSGLAEGEPLNEKVERLAKAHDSETLYQLAEVGLVQIAGKMAEAGAHFSAIREREHRSFKKFFDGRRLQYAHALYFIHVAEIVDRHSVFAGLHSSTALRELLRMTIPTQAQIAESLADVPMKEIDHIARGQIKKLHWDTRRRKDGVGGRSATPALEILQKWCKEIDVRFKKIYDLEELNLLEEDELEPLALRLLKGGELAHWRLKYPHGDVPYPDHVNPRLWIESEPDDGPVETPEYDISHLKKREIRVSLDKK